MSPCPRPWTIRCLSRATSSSSSARGPSLVSLLTGLHTQTTRPENDFAHSKDGFWAALELVQTHLGLMQNLYWMRMVMMKKTTPSTAMANRFFPTMSHSRGERNRFSPGTEHSRQSIICTHCSMSGLSSAAGSTKSLQGVGHGLVLHHVDESSTQTEVGEDEEDVL